MTRFTPQQSGDATPLRSIAWGGSAGALSRLDNPSGLAYAASSDELWVGDYSSLNAGSGGELLVFARSANGNVAPGRYIFGAATGLGEYVAGVAVNEGAGEVYAAGNDASGGNGTEGAIVAFPLSAQGDVAPLRLLFRSGFESP